MGGKGQHERERGRREEKGEEEGKKERERNVWIDKKEGQEKIKSWGKTEAAGLSIKNAPRGKSPRELWLFCRCAAVFPASGFLRASFYAPGRHTSQSSQSSSGS